MLDIKIKPTHDSFKHPVKGSEYAACWDVYAADIIHGASQEGKVVVTVNLGFATEFPPEYKGVIVPRSNLSSKNWSILNSPCHIDADYRGDWKVKFTPIPYICEDGNARYPKFPYDVGDRVAQIYFDEIKPFQFDLVTILADSARGSGGFGSSGVK